MLQLPGSLTVAKFLSGYWQRKPLFMPQAIRAMRPAVTRNELAWLATLEDVESRIVFTERDAEHTRYRVKTGPFDAGFLQALPKRDWSLLIHDVEKHLPAMRKLFDQVPFVPDWRVDDLMISFASPGGSVGPHRDNYDVFLCQGIGVREWRISMANVAEDATASDDLVLLKKFDGEGNHTARERDVLYLPPGIAHWGTARRACITYSIGMRAPPLYADPDLQTDEARPGYISPAAQRRAERSLDARTRAGHEESAVTLGCFVTQPKEWLQPLAPTNDEARALLDRPSVLPVLRLHGMARLAFDDSNVYLNGDYRKLVAKEQNAVGALCAGRRLTTDLRTELSRDALHWLLIHGAFEIPDNCRPYVS